jgi:hypothetical protein
LENSASFPFDLRRKRIHPRGYAEHGGRIAAEVNLKGGRIHPRGYAEHGGRIAAEVNLKGG